MKIDQIGIRGFRGFNEERTLRFHPHLTIFYGPNSFGKSSLTEGIEWLLYGMTYRQAVARSKAEYKGSLRNVHLDSDATVKVEAKVQMSGRPMVLAREVVSDDSGQTSVDGSRSANWPVAAPKGLVHANPFVLQHALQYLLMAKPTDRFEAFAHVLGLTSLERLRDATGRLATRPESALSSKANGSLKRLDSLLERLAAIPGLTTTATAYRKANSAADRRDVVLAAAADRTGVHGDRVEVLGELVLLRERRTTKVLPVTISPPQIGEKDEQNYLTAERRMAEMLTNRISAKYLGLASQKVLRRLRNRFGLFDQGVMLLSDTPNNCPLCGQYLTHAMQEHIRKERETLSKKLTESESNLDGADRVQDDVASLRSMVDRHHSDLQTQAATLRDLRAYLPLVEDILGTEGAVHYENLFQAVAEIGKAAEAQSQAKSCFNQYLKELVNSIDKSAPSSDLAETLSERLERFIESSRAFRRALYKRKTTVAAAANAIQPELDRRAMTEDLGILIELLERSSDLEKSWRIRRLLDSLKDLKQTVDQLVARKMHEAITSVLSSDVQTWYELIRTEGDPDVHFAGFDVPRRRDGQLRSRSVEIRASSYGTDLVSAVANLSESKLNALGLCTSIAINMHPQTPFGFVVIDDPIQSLDSEHEDRFIDIVRRMVEADKQVVLLSHNQGWTRKVRDHCADLNGIYYEFSGYSSTGPSIIEREWQTYKQRLEGVKAIWSSNTSDSLQIQGSQGEFRYIFGELACKIARRKLGIEKASSSLSDAEIPRLLLRANIKQTLVNRVKAALNDVSSAHHAPFDASQSRQRLRRHYDLAIELAREGGVH